MSGAQRLLEQRPPLELAIRQGKLGTTERELLTDTLIERYDVIIGLRKPNLRTASWEPAEMPVAEIARVFGANRETDILAISHRPRV